jgi:hypothetical protein
MYGAPVYDATGDKIGAVEEVFYDDRASSNGRRNGAGVGMDRSALVGAA